MKATAATKYIGARLDVRQASQLQGADMLVRRRCARTGVINVYTQEDPRLACGSIVEVAPSDYVWLTHIDQERRGLARHLAVAEAHLYRALGANGVERRG